MNELSLLNPDTALIPDELIKACFNCGTLEMRLILIAAAQAVRTKEREISFSINDYKKIMGIDYRFGKAESDKLLKSVEKCNQLQLGGIKCFSNCVWDNDNKVIRISFNADIYSFLENSQKYTEVPFSLISEATYLSIRWFMYLKSCRYKTQARKKNSHYSWRVIIKMQEIKSLFNIPEDKYNDRINSFIETIIKNPITLLNGINTEFYTSFKTLKKVRCILDVRFSCFVIQKSKLVVPKKGSDELKKEYLEDIQNLKIAKCEKWDIVCFDELGMLKNTQFSEESRKHLAETNTFMKLSD